ncbi:MAG: NAD(P)/FAD-dependent oxidoreductase [Anderseniella sp.]|jgi:monoamine oxidase|nr:NAD(P)/FAD-dependent oxidoreductase [Anderseniella sp.]
MTDPAVVIVGAGAAGVGAGLELAARGVPFIILEAQGRVGGRAYTDKTSLDQPWDQGCHWMHCADVNPLVEWADRLGAGYLKDRRDDWFGVWRDGGWLDKAGRQLVLDETWAPIMALAEIGARQADVPLSEAMDLSGQQGRLLRHWLRLMSSGDPEAVSARGYADYEDTETNWPVVTGYGDLIERMAAGLPVRLNAPVMAIEQGASGVRVEMADGVIKPRACIITASTNVLRARQIRFSPGPAQELLELVEDVPCGYYEKVAIKVSGDPFAAENHRGGSVQLADNHVVNFQISPYWPGLAVAHIAGTPARELAGAGPDALRDHVMEALVAGWGSGVRKQVEAMVPTGWMQNRHVGGAYSYAVAGRADSRHRMIKADAGSVAFAGEAFSLKSQATAHGAYQSGRDVAARMVDSLKLA